MKHNTRLWCNGSITVSKTVGKGSNPLGRAMSDISNINPCLRA